MSTELSHGGHARAPRLEMGARLPITSIGSGVKLSQLQETVGFGVDQTAQGREGTIAAARKAATERNITDPQRDPAKLSAAPAVGEDQNRTPSRENSPNLEQARASRANTNNQVVSAFDRAIGGDQQISAAQLTGSTSQLGDALGNLRDLATERANQAIRDGWDPNKGVGLTEGGTFNFADAGRNPTADYAAPRFNVAVERSGAEIAVRNG